MAYLSRFETDVQEIDDYTTVAKCYIEFKSHSDTSSELISIIVHKNADDTAIIESDITDTEDTLHCYKLSDMSDSERERLEELCDCSLDYLSARELTELILYVHLRDLITREDDFADDELNELIEAVKNCEIYKKFSS